MSTRKVGDYEWRQISMWDFAPDDCIERYERSGEHVFHFYLLRITEITSPNRWRVETVKSIDGLPDEVLNKMDSEVFIRSAGKSQKAMQ